MDIYDLMYSKDALNIYIYLFSNRNLNKEKEMKIKDILYVVYMYTFYYEKTQSVQKLFELFQKIHYIEDVDNLLSEDTYLSKFYQLFKIHEDILQENIKNEYQLYLDELKQLISKTNIDDILYFLKIKKEVDETYEKICNENISQEELEVLTSDLTERLEYLANYLSSSDIEAYKTYFEIKKRQSTNFINNVGIELFEFQKNNKKIDFTELKQLEELKHKTHSAIPLKINDLDNIKLEKEEIQQIRKYAINKILKDVIEFIIFYVLIGRLGNECYKNFIETQNSNMLIPIIIWLLIVILYFIDVLKYVLVMWKSKKKNKIEGSIGFVGDISWRPGQTSRRFYDIYFPRYNAHYTIRTNCATKKLKRKSMVKFIKVATKKIVISTKYEIL